MIYERRPRNDPAAFLPRLVVKPQHVNYAAANSQDNYNYAFRARLRPADRIHYIYAFTIGRD